MAARIIGLALAVLITSACSASFAQGRPAKGPVQPSFDYDPAGCSPPVTDGMVTISLGKRVLVWPFDRIIFNSPINPKRVPAASDPTAPEGCPENPVRGGNYALQIRFRTGTTTDSDNRPKSAIGRAELISVPEDFEGDYPIRSMNRRCAHDIEREIVDGLFLACRNSRGEDMLVRGLSYVALPEVYQAPDAKPFVIDCLDGPDSRNPVCRIYYKLLSDVSVHYKVVVRSKTQPKGLTLSEVIDFDRAFRAAVEAAWIKDYSWGAN